MIEEVPAQGETHTQFLVRKRRLAELMILVWQNVEHDVNSMIDQEGKEAQKGHIIQGFGTKLTFLNKRGRISGADLTTLRDFAKERQKLFHWNEFAYHPMAIPEDEKTRIIELAKKASQIALNRAFEVWSDETTGDIGNTDIPKPERLQH